MNHSHYAYLAFSTLCMKRVMDIVCSLLGSILLLPLVPIIALMVKLDSPGPVFFRQLRIGERCHDHTKLFMVIKFRTMVVDAEREGARWASQNDPRITKVGNFLRKTRLDEVPQLLNVLKGEMSLVGPRPERPGFYQKLEKAIPLYADRTYGIKPGVTGYAQVLQGYDETIEDVRNKVGYDHAYALMLHSTWAAFCADITILWMTISVVVHGRGQ
ncbi:MAG: sugar transferase [Rickettsiales bacterium]|nr:sugar transferase [Rickettsiales bacterium]